MWYQSVNGFSPKITVGPSTGMRSRKLPGYDSRLGPQGHSAGCSRCGIWRGGSVAMVPVLAGQPRTDAGNAAAIAQKRRRAVWSSDSVHRSMGRGVGGDSGWLTGTIPVEFAGAQGGVSLSGQGKLCAGTRAAGPSTSSYDIPRARQATRPERTGGILR